LVPVPEPVEARASEIEKAIHDQKGKVILVDCWATWCPPCVKKFPQLVETHKIYSDKGLACLGVCMDKYSNPDEYSKDKVFRFLTDKKATFPNLIVADPEADSAKLKKLLGDFSTIPFMALFDRNGRRVWTSDERPRLMEDELDGKIESLLAEKP
jgi:thiol-disulfide isomerase/thioredoxin